MTEPQPYWKRVSQMWSSELVESLLARAEVEAVARGTDLESARNKVFAEHLQSAGVLINPVLG